MIGGTSNAYYGLYALPFAGAGAVVLTGGIIMAVIGGKQRYEIEPDGEQAPLPSGAAQPPPPPPAAEPVPAIP